VVETARTVTPWLAPEARPRDAYGPFGTRDRCEAALETARAAPGQADWRIEAARCERRQAEVLR
jgi:hypothetical protein